MAFKTVTLTKKGAPDRVATSPTQKIQLVHEGYAEPGAPVPTPKTPAPKPDTSAGS